MQTILYGMDKQGPTLKLRDPYNIINQLYSNKFFFLIIGLAGTVVERSTP